MKICLISNIFPPHTIGGYELGCRDIALAFQQRGHDVTIATAEACGQLVKGGNDGGLRVERIFAPVFGFEADAAQLLEGSTLWHAERTEAFGGMLPGNMIALSRLLRQESFDVVWLYNTVGLGPVGIYEIAVNFCPRVGALLMDDIDLYVGGSRRNLNWRPRFAALKRRVDAISCSCKTMQMNAKIGQYRRNEVIYNGIRFAETALPVSPREDGALRICYLGQIEAPKGLIQAIEGLSVFHTERPDVPFEFVLYGRGSRQFREYLEVKVRELGLDGQVRLSGFIDRYALREELSLYDVGLLPLKNEEPFGYTPLEIAEMGVPVIVTATTGVAECLPKDYPLLLNDRDNPQEIAILLGKCWQNRADLREMGLRARAAFGAYCDFDRVTLPAYEEFLRAIPESPTNKNLRSALADATTCHLYANSRLPAERITGS